jgi:lipopolysaccharide export system permease protein
LLRPVVVFGLSVSAFLMVLTNLLVPLSQEQLSFRRGEVAGDIVATLLRPGTFLHPAEGMTLFITQITPEGMLRGLHVVDRRDPDTAVDYSARMALLVPDRAGPKLVMVDGIAQVLTSPEAARDQISVVRFADFTLDIGARSTPQDRARALAEVPSGELWATSDAVLAETRASPTHLAHERLVRIIEPLSAISAAILGFAVILAAGFTRLGLWRPVVAGVLVMALAQGLGNAIAGQSMRFDWAHWALPLPGLMLLGAGLGGLAHAMRQRRGRRP